MRADCARSMYPSVYTEEKVFLGLLAATVTFFLLAASSITPGYQDDRTGFTSSYTKGPRINASEYSLPRLSSFASVIDNVET